MNQLLIQDLSRSEDLDGQAMAAVRGGHRHHCCKHPGDYQPMARMMSEPEYVPVSETRMAQAGVGIFNVSDSSFGGTSLNITTGTVTATATVG